MTVLETTAECRDRSIIVPALVAMGAETASDAPAPLGDARGSVRARSAGPGPPESGELRPMLLPPHDGPGPQTMPHHPASRLPQLDILRGIAILMVLGFHPVVKLDESGCFWPLAYPWGLAGWTGVNLFFVLSGFLVGGLLLAELKTTGRLNPGRFMVRRMFKIWPSYYAFLFVMIAIALRAGLDPGLLWPSFFHVQNYLGTGVIGPHTWSLAVEEHFYLLLPLILSLTRSPRVLGLVLTACVLGCAVSRGMSHATFPAEATHHCLDSLGFGVLLAYGYHFRPDAFRRFARHPVALTILGLILVGLGLWPGTDGPPLAAAVVPISLYLGYGMILVAMLGYSADHGRSARFFASPPARLLVFIGVYSYSIYLWHIDIAYRLIIILGRIGVLANASPSLRWLTLTAGYLLLAIGAGVLFGRCIEWPALALRDRLVPRRDSSSPAVSSSSAPIACRESVSPPLCLCGDRSGREPATTRE